MSLFSGFKTEKNIISWFEIPVTDFDRARSYYEQVFRIIMQVEEAEGYRRGFFPIYKGKVSGAICQGKGYEPMPKGPRLFLNCNPDLQPFLDRVEPSGGKVVVGKTMIAPKAGYYAFTLDSEGNPIAFHSMK